MDTGCNEQAKTILAHINLEIDVWFVYPFAPHIWNNKSGLSVGLHIKTTKTGALDYDKQQVQCSHWATFPAITFAEGKGSIQSYTMYSMYKFWYRFVNKKLPNYFQGMFRCNYKLKKKSEPEATIGFTYIQPALVVLGMFWDITHGNH